MRNVFNLMIILFSVSLFGQYSNYYIQSDSRVNVNQNLYGVIHEYKTIKTIDYGALSLANAQNEINRMELMKINDAKQKEIAKSISDNPIKAYDYGQIVTFCTNDKNQVNKLDKSSIRKRSNFKEFCMSYVLPNQMLFNFVGAGRIQNKSDDGITTDILFDLPYYNKENEKIDLEKEFSYSNLLIGEEFENKGTDELNSKYFLHKKDLKRRDVAGIKGYRATIVTESSYEKIITDNYVSLNNNIGNGYTMFVKVRFYGDTENVTFEELEGRRFYLNSLIEKIISTIKIYNLKI